MRSRPLSLRREQIMPFFSLPLNVRVCAECARECGARPARQGSKGSKMSCREREGHTHTQRHWHCNVALVQRVTRRKVQHFASVHTLRWASLQTSCFASRTHTHIDAHHRQKQSRSGGLQSLFLPHWLRQNTAKPSNPNPPSSVLSSHPKLLCITPENIDVHCSPFRRSASKQNMLHTCRSSDHVRCGCDMALFSHRSSESTPPWSRPAQVFLSDASGELSLCESHPLSSRPHVILAHKRLALLSGGAAVTPIPI